MNHADFAEELVPPAVDQADADLARSVLEPLDQLGVRDVPSLRDLRWIRWRRLALTGGRIGYGQPDAREEQQRAFYDHSIGVPFAGPRPQEIVAPPAPLAADAAQAPVGSDAAVSALEQLHLRHARGLQRRRRTPARVVTTAREQQRA